MKKFGLTGKAFISHIGLDPGANPSTLFGVG
jgi:hypothetical protein